MIDVEIHKVNTLISQNKISEAISYLGDLFQSFIPVSDKIDVLALMGELFGQLEDYEGAEKSYTNALKLLQKQDDSGDEHLFNLSLLAFNLAKVKTDLKKTKEALDLYLQSLELLQKIDLDDPMISEQKAMTNQEIAVRYSELKDFYQCRKYANAAIDIYESLIKIDPERFSSSLANCYVLIGESYEENSDLNTAIVNYKKAAVVYENLPEREQNESRPFLAAIFNNIAVAQKQLNLSGKSAEFYTKTLEIYRKLCEENPEQYEPFLAATYNSFGVLYTDLNMQKKGIDYYEKALQLYQKLAYSNPELYTHYVATTTHNLGVIYDEMKEYDTALEYYEKALETRRDLAIKEPIAFNMDTSVTLLNIITLYHSKLENEKDLAYREPAKLLIEEAETRLKYAESEIPVLKSMKSDLEYFKEFFDEIDASKL